MIFGDFLKWDMEKKLLSPGLAEALDYIRNLPLEEMEDGSYPVNGDGAYLIVKETATSDFAKMRPEHHERYIDIHYIISGAEKIGFARNTGNNKPVLTVQAVEDHTFFDHVEQEMELILYPGQYAVFLPSDIHRPWCSHNDIRTVRKALLKLPV